MQRVEPSPCIHTQGCSAGLEGTSIFKSYVPVGPGEHYNKGVATELSPAVLPSAADPALTVIFSPVCERKEAELAKEP